MRDPLLILVNAFIVAYLLVAWGWNLPPDMPLQRLVNKVRGVVLYLGLWHSWNMFAPEPLYVNRRLSAVLYLANGETRVWEALDVGRMPWWRAFFEVRDRKYQDNLLSGELAYLKPALCEWLAWECFAGRLRVAKSGERRVAEFDGSDLRREDEAIPHPGPLPVGEGGIAPVGPRPVGEGGILPTGSRPVGEDGIVAAGTKVVKIELVMLRRLVPPPEKRDEPLPDFERHVLFAYDVARNAAIPLAKKVES